jgi:hypothetical protein
MKVSLESVLNGEYTCDAPGCDAEDFNLTSLAGSYDLQWRFIRRLSLLASVGLGYGWSSSFPDNGSTMIRSSLGFGVHLGEQWQITLSAVRNNYLDIGDGDKYAVTRGMFGFRYDFE